MIEIISENFIKKHNINDLSHSRRIYGKVCSLAGIFLNLILFVFKLTASVFSGSVAAAVDAVHNLTDSASSCVTLISFILSGKRKTKKYPMGLGRIEYVAGFIVSVVLISAGTELAKASVSKIITPEPVTFSLFSVVMLTASFFVKLYMAFFNKRISRKISSAALEAASTDCLCDSIATLVATLAVILVNFTSFNADAWGGLIVSLFILFAGCKSAKDTIKMIVGKPVDESLYNMIKEKIEEYSYVLNVEEIALHDYGPDNRIMTVKVSFKEINNMQIIEDLRIHTQTLLPDMNRYELQIIPII
ncbi:MAG: cation transporter [Clostridia bacterium]|nr:cation transporter [Clostridia bacterium]